jgi:outer membrane protein TolC
MYKKQQIQKQYHTKIYTMKRILRTVFLMPLLFASLMVSAQESVIEDINYTQLEQFIEMSKVNYPKNKVMALNEEKAKRLAPMEALTYLDMFNVAYYYRPNDRISINPENPYSVNGFQFSVSTSIGRLVSTPSRVKQAKIEYEIAKLDREDYEKLLISEVKSRYYQYIYQLKELKLKTQDAQDAKGIADDIALRFERGEVEIDIYNVSKRAYNDASSDKMETEVNYLVAKDRLEEIIGKKLAEL